MGEIVALKAEIADLRSKAAYEQDDDPMPSRGRRKTGPIEVDEEYLPPVIRPILRGAKKELEGRVTKSTSSRLPFELETAAVPTVQPAVTRVPTFGGISGVDPASKDELKTECANTIDGHIKGYAER
jgi:hypothetical protein